MTLALNGTAGRVLKVEFVSSANSGTKKTFLVTLGAGQQNYTFDISGFGTVGLINFVADETGLTSYTVETKGLNSIPVVDGVTFDYAALTIMPNHPVLSATSSAITGGTVDGTITQTQTASNTFNFSYTLADSDDFVFNQLSWGYFNASGSFVGTAGNVGNTAVIALNGPAGEQLKVEVWDANHQLKSFLLNEVK